MSKTDLKLDWATHEAAKYACRNWHYSKSVPAGKCVYVGTWEYGKYIGVVVFARGSNKHIGKPFGCTQIEAVELVRVALKQHSCFVSRVVSIAIKFLKKQSPGLRIVISFADPNHGHHGGIYQAGNWLYSGFGTIDKRCRPYIRRGVVSNWRTVAGELNKKGLSSTIEAAQRIGFTPQTNMPKHRYLMPLDKEMRNQIEPLRKPYPKRPTEAVA